MDSNLYRPDDFLLSCWLPCFLSLIRFSTHPYICIHSHTEDNPLNARLISGSISTITKAANKVFYKYELVKNTGTLTETITASVENGTVFYAQELTVVLNKLQANTRNEILLLAKNTLMAVVQDANDKYWLLGRYSGLDVTGGTAATGTAQGDRNGYTLTFTGGEKELSPEVASGIIAGLTS